MEFLWSVAISVILVYIILASQFESFVHPFAILLSLLLSVVFEFISLLTASQMINLYSVLGLLVLFGVVKKNATLQIGHMNKLREKGLGHLSAIMQGNRERLRSTLMTPPTLIAGMLLMALGTGSGAEEHRAAAAVVIGGQALCLCLLLTQVVALGCWTTSARKFNGGTDASNLMKPRAAKCTKESAIWKVKLWLAVTTSRKFVSNNPDSWWRSSPGLRRS